MIRSSPTANFSPKMIAHPYYPRDLQLNYVEPQHSLLEILIPFFTATAALVGVGSYYAPQQKVMFSWFLVCGVIHTLVEGYFVLNANELATKTTFLADLWKEYAKSDSRYVSGDSFVWVMEAVTSFTWGSLSFVTAYCIAKGNNIHYLLQIIVSLGQLYGDVLYYSTTIIEGSPHCDPHPYYFYFYFVFMNAFWIVIPLYSLYSSSKIVIAALKNSQKIKSE